MEKRILADVFKPVLGKAVTNFFSLGVGNIQGWLTDAYARHAQFMLRRKESFKNGKIVGKGI